MFPEIESIFQTQFEEILDSHSKSLIRAIHAHLKSKEVNSEQFYQQLRFQAGKQICDEIENIIKLFAESEQQ